MKEKKTLKDIIHNKIINEIIMGNFAQNAIITEKQLVEMFAVSKSPVREALIELCNEGVLISMPRYGYQIVQLDIKSIMDAIEIRMLLEISGLEKTFKRLDSGMINELKKNINEYDENETSVDVWMYWNNNTSFHLLLNSFSENTLMNNMLKKTLGILSRAYAQYYWNNWKETASSLDIDVHRSIVHSLENKDFDNAILKLKEDINSMGNQFINRQNVSF